jgi:hypothetical protein
MLDPWRVNRANARQVLAGIIRMCCGAVEPRIIGWQLVSTAGMAHRLSVLSMPYDSHAESRAQMF